MTEKSDTLHGHLHDFIADTLSRCTQCGKCFEACPMTRYGEGLSEADPKTVVSGVLDWLKQTPGNEESVKWLKVCTQSSRCIEACPEGINAMKMVRVAQMSALGSLGAPAVLNSREEKDFFRKINAFSETQMTADEIARWQR
ncbi:MAG TPA: (Fe-S)-binding protein [Burkholderiales bacterium]|nr:(Fe-S)-binding protein [Burkholderiales bacterium]